MLPSKNPRLLTLDAMRGLAAIGVILFHLDFIGPFAQSGYLAVDFFFLLSGLVIARAYQTRLDRGLPFTDFLLERVIRLYPLYLLGFLVGLLRRLAQIATDHTIQMSWPHLGISAVFNVLMLPSPATDELAPINGPSWSIYFELLVNVVWASVLVKASKRTLAAYVVVLCIALCALIVGTGWAEAGYAWSDVHFGVIRSFFGFGLGVLLAKSWTGSQPRDSALSVVAAAALCAVLIVDVSPAYRAFYDIVAIVLCFPAIVYMGVAFNPPAALKRVATVLGDISYPVYMLHFGPLFSFSYLARKLGVSPAVWIPAFIVGICAVSLYLARTYDPAARRYLKRILSIRKRKTATAAHRR
ncbi:MULTISPECIES: acyltransferase [unclassified Variovorax]|jgi:peptidoglycan/LPS O-acetylase OafA/YrhL|uniref:acyltransferase family protein n=1 Tax=unclassified Variovorax TaxID=663243 RepID=UPI002B222945|nr:MULTISPECIES: acyltransferase [unclassified Variovorax]MEB0059211.1 acyltransferase [Variovorax sp. LG9.2]MEB0112522.1 acyltransferase [Variovorax sp. RTB1]